jgi:hypothetical protein
MLLSLFCTGSAVAASFSTATVTKVENNVLLGERQGEKSVTRAAAENDVMQARNFLRSENASRAEPDIGQGVAALSHTEE